MTVTKFTAGQLIGHIIIFRANTAIGYHLALGKWGSSCSSDHTLIMTSLFDNNRSLIGNSGSSSVVGLFILYGYSHILYAASSLHYRDCISPSIEKDSKACVSSTHNKWIDISAFICFDY